MKQKWYKQIGLIFAIALITGGILLNLVSCNAKTGDNTADNNTDTEKPTEITEVIPPEIIEKVFVEGEPYPLDTFEQSIVSVVQSDTVKNAEDLTQDDITLLVKQAIEYAGGLDGIVKDGDVVVLKPNLVTGSDYTLPGWQGKRLAVEVNGNCTDYRFVRAVAIAVREINPTGKIYVIEGSAQDTEIVMKQLNYTTENIPEVDAFYALEDISGKWQEKDAAELVKVNLTDGYLHKEYYVNRMIYEADAFICLPLMKNHWNACITGSIKNIGIGSTPSSIYGTDENSNGRNNMVNHDNMDLHNWIADFYTCRPADFTITDALQGIEYGPTPCYDLAGITDIKDAQMNMRMVLAGKDAVAVDTVESQIMNWDPNTVGYLTQLEKRGLGNVDTTKIIVTGNRTISEVRTDFENTKPSAGGIMVEDLTPPEAPSAEAVFTDANTLTITHGGNTSDAVKLEFYLDGILKAVYCESDIKSFNYDVSNVPYEVAVYTPKDGTTVTVDSSALTAGEHELTVASYDKYMNRSETIINITK